VPGVSQGRRLADRRPEHPRVEPASEPAPPHLLDELTWENEAGTRAPPAHERLDGFHMSADERDLRLKMERELVVAKGLANSVGKHCGR
jgi:hypothetical protein